MKKKTVVFGSLLAVFLLLIIPHVSAITYQTVVNETKQYRHEELRNTNFDLNKIIEKMKFLSANEFKNNDFNSETFHMLLWIFYALCFGFFTLHNLMEKHLLDSFISFISFVISIVSLKQVVNGSELKEG